MATTTLNATANSGGVRSDSTTYSTARSGGGTLTAAPANDARIGQSFSTPNYFCWQFMLEFDLSALAGATITDAALSLYVWAIDGTGYDVQARAFDYGASLETSDFRAGASLSGDTLLAHWTVAAPDSVYKAFTNDGLVTAADGAAGGTLRMIVSSFRQANNDTPTGAEYITAYFDGSGGQPPKLDLTYTPPAAAESMSPSSLSSLHNLRSLVR